MDKMNEVTMLAFAKINLCLDITGIRDDGYHTLDMVNQSVDLCDRVEIRRMHGTGIRIKTTAWFLPKNEKNTVHKAVTAFFDYTGIGKQPLDIFVRKKIPTQAGLGGGSADAAAALVGVNAMFDAGLTTKQLCDIGEKVGADVPFCIVGGTARVRGIGEDIAPIKSNCDYSVVIAMPHIGRSTREAFKAIDSKTDYERPDADSMVECLEAGDVSGVAVKLCNVFHTANRDEISDRLIATMLDNGALNASLSGSGAAVFGIFKTHLEAQKFYRIGRHGDYRLYLARPETRGVQIINSRLEQ